MIPEPVREQLETNLPDLFSAGYESVLYVGANAKRQHFLQEFVDNFKRVRVLEVFEQNVSVVRAKYAGPNVEIIQGDVRNAEEIFSEI